MKKVIKRVLVALNLQTLDSPGLVSLARSVVRAFTGNTYFTAAELAKLPTPLTEITTMATNLENTHTTRKTNRSATLTSLEQEQATLLANALGDTATFVESLANKKAAGDLPLAVQIITSAGFQVKKEFIIHQRSFEIVETGKDSAHVRTKADGPRTIYMWRWTATPNDEKSWKVVEPTVSSNIVIVGLPSATTIYFSFAAIHSRGKKPVLDAEIFVREWSDPLSAVTR